MNSRPWPHIPIMLEEVLQFFAESKIATFFDGTVGGGGHAAAILDAHQEIETYIGCDQDPEALEIAAERLRPWRDKVRLERSNFSQIVQILTRQGIQQVDGFFLI